jgi:hypothetical protein
MLEHRQDIPWIHARHAAPVNMPVVDGREIA